MAILICAATAKELKALAPELLPPEDKIREMQPMACKLKQRDAIFLVTGTGPVNASLALGFCFGLAHESKTFSIDSVLCTGLAGAFDLIKNPLCSIWRVKTEIWPEYGLNDGARVVARAFRLPLWSRPGKEDIYEKLELDDLDALDIKPDAPAMQWCACASLTVAGATAGFNRKDALWNAWHAELENMEGFAAAYACARAEKPFVEIRIVANKVGPRTKDEKDVAGATRALGEILPALDLL